MHDADVVRAVLAGRTELFRELVDRHAPGVFRIVRSVARQAADAEDLAQDVFLSSYKNLARLRDPARFRAHLMVIAARKAADFIRRRRPAALPLVEEPAARESSSGRTATLVAAVEGVVQTLPEESRLVFALRHHEGLSCKQIAELLDVSATTIYTRLSRLHARIRARVKVAE